MEIIKNVKIGSDWELFVYNKEKQEIVNAKPFVKGTKEKPFNFDKSNPFWSTSLDNISYEGNIPPCTTKEDFSNSIQRVINYMNSRLPQGYTTVHDAACYVNPQYLRTKEARVLGCESSLNCYTLLENPRPNGQTSNLRTCCTHIHISYDNMSIFTSAELIKAMDLYLGIPSLVIEPLNDRRLQYGKSGEFRFSNKTTEYRVLSSYFSQNDNLRKWCFENTMNSINFINEGHRVSDDLALEIQSSINTNNTELANKIIQTYNIPMPI